MVMNPNQRKRFREALGAGLMLLLILVHSPVAEAGMWGRRDWSRVQAVVPGTRTTVLLYKDRAPRGRRKIEGQFHSATVESVTLIPGHGQTRTLQKQAVEKVLVYRSVEKRYQGWLTAGILTAIVAGSAARDEGPTGRVAPAGIMLVVGVPTLVAFLVAPKMGGVYNVPPDRRNDPTQTPSQHGWVTPADMRKAGSRLVDEAIPGRLWLHAREARIRDGILLDSSTPARIASLAKHGQPPHLVARGRRTGLKNREGSYGSQSLAQVAQHRNDEGPQAEDHFEQHGQEGAEGSGGRSAR